MKLSGVRADPLAAVRRRAALRDAVGDSAAAGRIGDSAAFLGLSAQDLTGPVQAAMVRLFGEIDELRAEVGRLKAHLVEAEALADRDALTPVFNRRAFVRELARALLFADRYGGVVSLVYFDLDGFKAVNDRFGHAAGDGALKAVADQLRAGVRASDVVGRLGGDEFGVLLSQADEAVAQLKAQSLAKAIHERPIQSGEWMAPLRVTFGVAQARVGESPDQLLARADAAMYASKKARAAG